MIAFQASHSSRSASRIFASAALRISTDLMAFVDPVGVPDALRLGLAVAARQRDVDDPRGLSGVVTIGDRGLRLQNSDLLHDAGEGAEGVFVVVDGAGSRGCRILGRLRPVRIVRKRGAIPYQSAGGEGAQIALHVAVALQIAPLCRAVENLSTNRCGRPAADRPPSRSGARVAVSTVRAAQTHLRRLRSGLGA